MKKELFPSILLTLSCIMFFCIVYPAIVWGIAQFTNGKGEGVTVRDANGKTYYDNVGQKFNEDKYFSSRPSAVDYHADGAGGSNKGPTNPEYLSDVQKRIDTFLSHNPSIKENELSSDLVTASGSGIDPNISVQAALIQIPRIAKIRRLQDDKIKQMVNQHIEKPLSGLFGTEKINVLKLNIDLDHLK